MISIKRAKYTQGWHVNDNSVSKNTATDERENWITNCNILSKVKYLPWDNAPLNQAKMIRSESPALLSNQKELSDNDSFLLLFKIAIITVVSSVDRCIKSS